ncbi:MAG: hypothetical protein CL609_10760 [Anaerolineaceae bacterium]|nr:hypothetical protein [Anaerolineaceae bacterium]
MKVEFIKYTGPNFQIVRPTNWTITSSPAYQVMFIAPPLVPNEKVPANLMVNQRLMEDEVSMDEIVHLSHQTQQKEYKNFQLLNEEKNGSKPHEVYKQVYTWKNTEGVGIYQQQVFILVHNLFMTITMTRQNGKEFIVVDPIFAMMVSSLTFDQKPLDT